MELITNRAEHYVGIHHTVKGVVYSIGALTAKTAVDELVPVRILLFAPMKNASRRYWQDLRPLGGKETPRNWIMP